MLLGVAAAAWGAPPAASNTDDPFAVAAEHYSAGQWQEAADGFLALADAVADKDRAANDRAAAARFYAGEALVQLGKLDQGQRQLTQFLDEAPGHRFAKSALFRLGECLLLAGNGPEAIGRLEQFRTTYPSDELNGLVLAYLGELNLRAGKLDEALAHYERALREFPTGPMAMQCRFGIGRAQLLAGKPDESLAAYRQVAAGDGPLADDAALQIAIVQYKQQQYRAAEEALSPFETTHRASELRPLSLYWRGLSQLSDGRPAEAAAALRGAIEAAAAGHAGAAHHFALADALRQAGDAAAADEEYSRVLDRWPQCEQADDALYGRLLIADEQDNSERAQSLAAELARRFPASPLQTAAQLTQARLLVKRQEYAAAEPVLDKLVLAGGPNQAQARYLLSIAQFGQQKLDAALATVEATATDDARLAAATGEVRLAALVGLKKFDQALPLLKAKLAATMDEAAASRWRTQLVLALAELGQIDEAASELDKLPAAALADEDAAGAALAVAEKAYRARNYALAKRWFETLARDTTPAALRGPALSGLAWTQLAMDGKQASAETFERVLREDPASPLAAEAALVRGRALEEQGDHAAALAAYRLVIDKHSRSPQLPAALLAAGRLHDKLDQDREAAELLARLVHDFPEFPERDAAIYAWAWVLHDQEQLDEADAQFTRLSDEYPASTYWADATYRLAQRAAQRKDHARAAELAERIIAADCPAEIQEHALYLRGQTAAALGQWSETAHFLQQLLEKHPATALKLSAEYWLAEAEFRQNRFAEARARFERLISESPGRQAAWAQAAPLRVVQCLTQEKRWDEAIAQAETALADQTQSAQRFEYDFLIGRCLASQGKLIDARAAYERVTGAPAAAGTETAAAAQWLIGEALFHQKRYADALSAYERCSGHMNYPRWQAAGLLQAGKCRLLLGQRDRAIADFKKLASELAETPYAAEARQRLAALESSSESRTQ
ncbi:MAG: tetratricopeptide repeat protein [Planctomycetaceae bacterium]|nr:tetratricopeptide repeat protein [Planctomycetaceae bacterium]